MRIILFDVRQINPESLRNRSDEEVRFVPVQVSQGSKIEDAAREVSFAAQKLRELTHTVDVLIAKMIGDPTMTEFASILRGAVRRAKDADRVDVESARS